jgi:aryl-alcohol dehydrogenase-like predicted oxidoreductase
VLHHPAVASAIVGIRTVDQLAGLDRAAELELDDAASQRLNEIFDFNNGRRIGQGRSPQAHSW